MAEIFLNLEGLTVQAGGVRLLDGLDWTILQGEQWAITGESGSGKTLLAHTLLGRHFYTGFMKGPERIAIVEQQHRFRGLPGATQLYYQQRFNSADADQTITVGQELADAGWPGLPKGQIDPFHIGPLLKKPLIQLSNGENKRVQLAMAMLERPEWLILDNPFLGLDGEGRGVLHRIIDSLAADGLMILLITPYDEMPACITHIAQIKHGRWNWKGTKDGYHQEQLPDMAARLDESILRRLCCETREVHAAEKDFSVAVKMVNTTVRYGNSIILENICWEVRKGERWNLSGPNGAGKSTMLSLITADNPQAYANEIWLFDRRRGTGESIWDIKKKIGFVSPELHLYFESGISCFEAVASGLFDTIGLFRPLDAGQEETVLLWMQLLSMTDLRGRRLAQLSAGQQRMVLLARALIKNPPMLILDEPCQGLDSLQTARFRALITALCESLGTTLIYVSHYRQELPACIDRFLQLDKGRIVTEVDIRKTGMSGVKDR